MTELKIENLTEETKEKLLRAFKKTLQRNLDLYIYETDKFGYRLEQMKTR